MYGCHTKNSGGMNQDVVLVISSLCSQTLQKLDICERSAGRGQIPGQEPKSWGREAARGSEMALDSSVVSPDAQLLFPKTILDHHFLCQVRMSSRSYLEHMLKRDHITQGLERIL